MHPISVMIKPSSSRCNLRCRYCFYADEAALRTVPDYGLMTPEQLERTIAFFMQAAGGRCDFMFQGGEPTLAGLDFFRRVVALEKRYARPGLQVTNALQTNGLLLDEDWCSFLGQNRFLVGLSLDGVKATHDCHRLRPDGKGSYSAVLRAAQRLQSHRVDFNILTVVTPELAQNITKVYAFYKRNNWLYQQYIPCMDPLEGPRGRQAYSLTPPVYAAFLKKLFDLWYQDFAQGFLVSIRYFDNLLRMMNSLPPESCAMTGHCNVQYLVEADGSVFPCDFYATDRYCLGNLNTEPLRELDEKRRTLRFVESSAELTRRCTDCRWYGLCRGGCRRDYTAGEDPRNYYCESYRVFFEYAGPRLLQAARFFGRQNLFR